MRTTIRRLAPAAFAGVLAAGFAAPTAASAQENTIPLTEGQVTWGIHTGFTDYVEGPIAGGEITVSQGAQRDGKNFTFPSLTGSYDLSDHHIEASTEGAVRFTGHHGALDLTIASPSVVTDNSDKSGVLSVTITQDSSTETVAFADLSYTGGSASGFEGMTASLTAEGAEAMGGFYNAGDELPAPDITFDTAQEDGGGDEDSGGGSDEESEDPGDTGGGENEDGDDSGDERTDETASPNANRADPVLNAVSGSASWGVKESFRSYATGPIADGSYTAVDGASEEGGVFSFPVANGTFNTDTGAVDLAFTGGAHFTGHGGELDVTLGDVRLQGTGKSLALYLNGTAAATVDLGQGLSVADERVSVSDVPVTLTESGAKLFSGNGTSFYKAGDALDPLSFTVDFDGTVTAADFDKTGNLPTTGMDLTWILGIALALTAAGVVAVVATRRRPANA
ncbi:HtaA domain-containing protein [Salininema proteolyticum]|uniref:HtaA domain-containing protein n=1 Tax=Salininema proteolyticum TaxID=1607685 RepID=A0ABV8U4I5_9ACTN